VKPRVLVLAVGALLTIPVIVFLAIGLRHDPHQIDSPLIGKPAPPFALADLEGNVVRLEDLRGTPVLLNFWATYCVPCVAEHKTFMTGERVLGERLRLLLEQRGEWGRTLVDPGSQVAIAYGVYGVPETYLIDAEGIVIDKITWPLVTPEHLFAWLGQHGLAR
jgi:cytochrome c biogenesis protein CcmG/thiol:disulfide interchange protein DsbE